MTDLYCYPGLVFSCAHNRGLFVRGLVIFARSPSARGGCDLEKSRSVIGTNGRACAQRPECVRAPDVHAASGTIMVLSGSLSER